MADCSPLQTPTRGFRIARTPRPILRKTYIPGPSSSTTTGSKSRDNVDEQKPAMATSFLQFCAMCEKQIMTPLNSILYCSEACRRKDSCKPLSAATISTAPTAPITPPPSEPPSPRATFIAQGSKPASYYTSRNMSTDSIPSELHDHSSDLDPTEWKPIDEFPSDAQRYLSQYQLHRCTTPVGIPTPSLRLTPTTTASSSLSTSIGGGNGSYDCRSRPLPRQDRWYGLSHGTPKGVDLVTPHIPPTASIAETAIPYVDGGAMVPTYVEGRKLSWDKKKVTSTKPSRRDGLSVLFADG